MKEEPEYKCVLTQKPRKTRLRAKKWTRTVPGKFLMVEGFTRGEDGVDRPNGLRFPVEFIPD